MQKHEQNSLKRERTLDIQSELRRRGQRLLGESLCIFLMNILLVVFLQQQLIIIIVR